MLAVVGLPLATVAMAQSGATRVSVDWSQVDDRDVTRCRLGGLRSGTIERLVADGYAVVEDAGEDGIAVGVRSDAGGLRLAVRGGGVEQTDLMALPEACDATIVLAVIGRVSELVGEVHERLPPPAPIEADAPPAPAPWSLSLEMVGRMSSAPSWLLGAGLATRLSLGPALSLGGRAELSGNRVDGVTVLEAYLAGAALYSLHDQFGLYAEFGPLIHHGQSQERSYTGVDGLAAAGVQVRLGPIVAQLLVSARARRFVHRRADREAFDTGYFGFIARLGWQLLGG